MILKRKGARRRGDVPAEVLRLLKAGEIETVNLMEWLAADMALLAASVAGTVRSERLALELQSAAMAMPGQGVTRRLALAGRAIARSAVGPNDPDFLSLATHRSDLVRQWACYAVNDGLVERSLDERLAMTKPFAADSNMSVREAAWMAFRPYLQVRLTECVPKLALLARDDDANIRRFAVEVTRPRSVWGAHLGELKRAPRVGLPVLESVHRDPSRYVQLAVGNWLNDAAKSQPDWVSDLCARWSVSGDKATAAIVRRGMRTVLSKEREQDGAEGTLLSLNGRMQ